MSQKWTRLLETRRYWPTLMIGVGLALLLYVSVQYGRMHMEQRRLAQAWEKQQHELSAIQDDGLTRLLIPKINLNAIIVEGTSRKDLLVGPGHMAQTAKPGESGNSVVTAHRDTFFRHLHELNKGDVLKIQREGKTYLYEVAGKRIVSPDDISVLKASDDSRLTLITCYPTYFIGPAPERLVVFSKLVDTAPGPAVAQETRETAASRQK